MKWRRPHWCHFLRSLNDAFNEKALSQLTLLSLLSLVQLVMEKICNIEMLKRVTGVEEYYP